MQNTLFINSVNESSSENHDFFQISDLQCLLNDGLYETGLNHGRPASDVFADLEKHFGFKDNVSRHY